MDWGQPYIDLLDPPSIVPYLDAILGPRFRLDHTYLDIIRGGLSPIGATLHGGAMPFNPVQYFHYSNGEFHNGLSVVAFNLADVNPGDGGFACVPGSHKSNLPFPDEWKDLTKEHDTVKRVTGSGRYGHYLHRGANSRSPCRGPPTTSVGPSSTSTVRIPLAWWGEYPTPEGLQGLTERQQSILEGPNARYPERGISLTPAVS